MNGPDDGDSPGRDSLAAQRRTRRLPWPARRVLELLALALVVEYLLLPQLAGTRKWLHLLLGVDRGWLALALAAELASLLAFALSTRALLPRGGVQPRLHQLVRIDLATIALSHAVPGGAAAGTALGYRLLTSAGVSTDAAGFAKFGQGVVSALVLQLLLWSALAIAIPLHGSSPLYLTTTAVGAVLLIAVIGFVVTVLRGETRVTRWAAAITARVPGLTPDTGRRITARTAGHLRAVAASPGRFAATAGWSAANWLFDAAALWCGVRAFGHTLGYDGLLVPFGLANVAAWIPITPSGLGVVEGVVVPFLVGFGVPRGVAILGTITWRLVNFWLPIPLGAAAYLTLGRVTARGDDRAPHRGRAPSRGG
jgi:uncharacterized protein (TIRG00374 family)